MFPDLASVWTNDLQPDDEGTVIDEWTLVEQDIPAQLSAPDADTELRTDDGIFTIRPFKLILYGWHPLVDEAARITLGERIFDVRGVVPDSWGVANGPTGWMVLTVEERPVTEEAS